MRILTLFIFCVVLSACGSETDKNTTDGKALYDDYCRSCHGDDGDLGASGARPLSQSMLDFEDKVKIVTHGSGGMMPYKDMMTREQIEEVVKYIETLKK